MTSQEQCQPNLTICAIEGNIGAGKSTLLERKAFSDKTVQEPLEVWNRFTNEDGASVLDAFYSNPSKYAFLFQILALTSRVESLRNRIILETQKQSNTDEKSDILLLTERSPQADKHVFASMLLPDNSLEQQVYHYVFSVFQTLFPRMKPDHTVLFQSDVATCASRIRKRNRPGEENIDQGYLQNLNNGYQKMFASIPPAAQSLIDSNGSIAETELALQKALDNLQQKDQS